MKKRLISVLTAIVFVFSMGLSAFAAGTVDTNDVVIVNNYVGTPDTITVSNSSSTNLLVGDKIKVYKDVSGVAGTTAIATSTAAAISGSTTQAAVTVGQLSADSKGQAGYVWISILSGTTEGTKVKVAFGAEPITTTPSAATITNMASDGKDTISVTGLSTGYILKAYADSTTATVLGQAVVPSTGDTTTAAISLPGSKLGDSAGSVYLTLTAPASAKKHESARQSFAYSAAPQVTTPSGVVVVNNVDAKYKDTITLTGLQAGDTLTAYNNSDLLATHKISQAIVPTKGDTTTAAISLPANKFGASGGTIYVNVKRKGYITSDTATVNVPAEAVTSTPAAIDLAAYNFNGEDNVRDVVTVKNTTEGAIVYVYNDATATTPGAILMKGTVKKGRTSISLVSASKAKDFNANGGTVYISIKNPNQNESDRRAVTVSAEQ